MTANDAPDVAGPVIGVRLWRLDARRHLSRRYGRGGPNDRFGELQPMNWPRIPTGWPGWQPLHAVCNAEKPESRHYAPGVDCRCGIYAFKTVAQVEESLLYTIADDFWQYATRKSYSVRKEIWLAAGTVAHWGRIVEGTHGYRAEYAYPDALWVLPPAILGREDIAQTSELLPDLIRAMRSRYGVRVGYAGHAPEWNALITRPSVGPFFAWRFDRSGGDLLYESLGDLGQPSNQLPTVGDALERHIPRCYQPGREWEQLIATRYLTPAFGDAPLQHLSRRRLAHYRAEPPRNPATGRPYSERTIRRHLAILRGAVQEAAALGWHTAREV